MEFPTLESYPDLPSADSPENELTESDRRPFIAPQNIAPAAIFEHGCISSLGTTFSVSSQHHLAAAIPGELAIGTRNSRLAMVQAEQIQSLIKSIYPEQSTALHSMTTTGDENLSRPLYLLGGKSLWTKELEVALLDGAIDMIVHSLKDMPTVLPPGCELGAIIEREDPRDALVVRKDLPFKCLGDLPTGSVIGTSSVRRVAQLRRRFPHLAFQDIRGNLNTRFKKLDAPDSPYTAIILAVAGLNRLSFSDRISSFLEPPDLYHAVGQGAIGIEIRTPPEHKSDETEEERDTRERLQSIKRLVKTLEDWRTAVRCEAERALLRRLEGGCSVPIGVDSLLTDLVMPCPWAPKARLRLIGVITSVDGKEEISEMDWKDISTCKEAKELGDQLAVKLLESGGSKILDELNHYKNQSSETSETTRIQQTETQQHIHIAAPADSLRTVAGSNHNHSSLVVVD